MSYKSTDVKTPGIVAIAKKWKLPVAKVMELVNQGAEVEKEHNKSIVKARQVARDHINERPDYYSKLKKMEKTPISMKEETGVGGVRGLGYTSGDPAGANYVQQYIDSNAMSYQDENGNKLEYNKKNHKKYHRLSFNDFDPKSIKTAKNFVNEGISAGPERSSDYSIGDPGGGRTLMRPLDVKEGAKLDKAKKVAMAGVTAANMYTMADVAGRASEGGHGSPKADIVRAASALPGAAGWGATAVHYGKKGYDLARDALKKKSTPDKEQIKEDLRKWFREKWVRYDTKGNIKGPCARDEGEGKPKCRPLASARAMSKDERAKSARRKRREDPVADRPGKGGKPVMVKTNEETLLEKNVPTNPALWAKAKAQAKAKFDVYPSAYANGWASKWYKSKGGGWKSAANESVDEACWSGYKAKGMKKKGSKMVPNCVPVEEHGTPGVPARYTERPTYENKSMGENLPKVGGAERGIYEDWSDVKHQNPSGGLKKSGVMAYRREHPGSKLQTAVTTKPSKLKKGSKAANRRKSFCARMGGMKKRLTSAKTARDPDSRINKALRKWNCEESVINELRAETLGSYIKKASASRKKSLEGPKADIKTWGKRQKGITTAVKQLTKENSRDKDFDMVTRFAEQQLNLNKPDVSLERSTYKGATGTTRTIHEETTMENQNLVNEAIENILDNNLNEMKENLMSALQEKANEKLEERKKIIAANYFAQ